MDPIRRGRPSPRTPVRVPASFPRTTAGVPRAVPTRMPRVQAAVATVTHVMRIGISTSMRLSAVDRSTRSASRRARRLRRRRGDGDARRDDADPGIAARAVSQRFGVPMLSIHAPVLLLTHFVWGRDPQVKLERSAELAGAVGAPTVVVHPPFRWQAGYAEDFLGIVRRPRGTRGVEIAVENMFPWKLAGRASMAATPPAGIRGSMDCDAVTLDFSHAALSGIDTARASPTNSATGSGTCTCATAPARSTRAGSSTSTCCPATGVAAGGRGAADARRARVVRQRRRRSQHPQGPHRGGTARASWWRRSISRASTPHPPLPGQAVGGS